MDLDDIEYLEKGVEDPENSKAENQSSGGGKREGEKSYRSSRRRTEDDENGAAADDERVTDSKRSSKRSRGENGSEKRGEVEDRDRDRERERSSRSERRSGGDKDRHRSSRDLEKETERDRGDRGERRERDGGRGDRGGREREREREKGSSRDKEREREKEKEREREKERSRRSSSHSGRHRSDTEKDVEKEAVKEVVRGKSRDREIREAREKEREQRDNETREREREMSRRFKDKKENMEPEADPERDQRTVFAYQMPLKATERDVYEFFSKAGKVRDVRLIMDRNSRRSKGVGYIEFYDSMSVPMAIALSGHQLFGQPVMVKPSEAEKNLVQSTATLGGSAALAGPYGAVARKLYIGNLHFNMTEEQLRQVFEPFGPVELVQLPLDLETGQCKGFGFVQFAQLEHAKAAQSLNGKLEIAGRVIKVSAVTDHVGVQNAGANAADFDDDDGGGLSLNAQSRAMLMQKLDRTGVATSIVGSLGVPMVNGQGPVQPIVGLPLNLQAGIVPALAVPTPSEPIGNPSECLLLKNMFDPASETEPDFDLDIRDEVQEECSQFGPVKHCYVDKHSAGHVYLRFETVAAAASCQRAMHARWFARRLIAAIFMQPHEYEAKFSGSG